jgi:hypothetical protein
MRTFSSLTFFALFFLVLTASFFGRFSLELLTVQPLLFLSLFLLLLLFLLSLFFDTLLFCLFSTRLLLGFAPLLLLLLLLLLSSLAFFFLAFALSFALL